MAQNNLQFCSKEHSYMDTLVSKLLKSSLEKANDDHDVFGAYVAMELRNLKTSDAQIKLRLKITDAISQVVRTECMTTVEQFNNPSLNEKHNEPKELNDLTNSCATNEPTVNNVEEKNLSNEKRMSCPSWEFIN